MLKRLVDFSSALLGILLVLPFFPLIWLIIKFSSQSSVFTGEDRVGKNNKPIRLYRFSVSSDTNDEDGSLTYPVRVLRFLRLVLGPASSGSRAQFSWRQGCRRSWA